MPPQSTMILKYRIEGENWKAIQLPEGNLSIGRGSNCDLRLFGSHISRQHAEIRRRGKQTWIVDLGSSNGTKVDDEPLANNIPHPLLPGHRITIGDYSLVMEVEETPIAEPGKKGGRVFISYSRRNQDIVYALVTKLQSLGFDVWIDKQEIKPGAPWRGQIVQGISESDAFMLLLSPDSVTSDNVRKELDIAIDAEVLVLPVILLPMKVPDTMKYQLAGVQHVNLFNEPETGFEQMMAALRERQAYLAEHPRMRRKELQAEVYLPGITLSEFYADKQRRLVNFLAQVTNVNPNTLSLASYAAGSVRVIVNLPAAAAYELKAQALNANPVLIEAGISALRLVGDLQFIQTGYVVPPGAGTPEEPPPTPPDTAPHGGPARLWWWVAGTAVLIAVAIIVTLFIIQPKNPPPVAPTIKPVQTKAAVIPAKPSKTATRTPAPIPSKTAKPTVTPHKTSTPTRTATASPTPTNTVFVCAPYLRVEMNAFCRKGPGKNYDILTGLTPGEQAQIDGQNQNMSIKWWWIQLPNSPGHCWISDVTVSTYGNPSCVNILPDPPTPTPTPVDLPPPAPSLISPTNNQVISSCYYSTNISLIWSGVTDPDGISSYEWELEQYNSSYGYSSYKNGSTASTSADVLIECPYDYRWHVRARDGAGNVGPYSSYAAFSAP